MEQIRISIPFITREVGKNFAKGFVFNGVSPPIVFGLIFSLILYFRNVYNLPPKGGHPPPLSYAGYHVIKTCPL